MLACLHPMNERIRKFVHSNWNGSTVRWTVRRTATFLMSLFRPRWNEGNRKSMMNMHDSKSNIRIGIPTVWFLRNRVGRDDRLQHTRWNRIGNEILRLKNESKVTPNGLAIHANSFDYRPFVGRNDKSATTGVRIDVNLQSVRVVFVCVCVCVIETIARRVQDETTIGTNVSVLCSRNKMFARRNACDRKAPALAGEQCRRNASAASDRVVYGSVSILFFPRCWSCSSAYCSRYVINTANAECKQTEPYPREGCYPSNTVTSRTFVLTQSSHAITATLVCTPVYATNTRYGGIDRPSRWVAFRCSQATYVPVCPLKVTRPLSWSFSLLQV